MSNKSITVKSRSARKGTPQQSTLSIRTNIPNQKKKKPARKRVSRQRIRGQRTFHLSNCASLYLSALVDPFNTVLKDELPCIPDSVELPSYKFSTVVRSGVPIGANGQFFVSCNPFVFCSDNPTLSISISGASPVSFETSGSANCVAVYDTQFPWTSTSLRKVRLVACGLRCRYYGKEINLGGYVIPIASQTDNSIVNRTQAQILSRQDLVRYPLDRKWRGCFYRPTEPTDLDYSATTGTAASGTGIIMGITGFGTAGEPIEVELVRFFEAITQGDQQVPSVSRSHSDAVGLSAVRDALGAVSNSAVGQSVLEQAYAYLKNHAAEDISTFASIATATKLLL